ncbi:GtrA family protein [Novilysobacter avium]|uniref:GtrA family protein n=1 Tax=Novilysobacter avium TaxID=2781023 RepID=A0A7S6ZUW7_9GAMM|nr:GtrA family protein [Lysobacter avium]QOW21674.1 GtrA family protein [Lysobacter avium]
MHSRHWITQSGRYLLFGVLQLALDTAIYIALTSLGVMVVPANVIGRLIGASAGFMFNGRITFASPHGHQINRGAFARYALLWLMLTLVGSTILRVVEQQTGLIDTWYAKPLVEASLAVLGFTGLKFFVFRRHRLSDGR